jgi:hypothetical protein
MSQSARDFRAGEPLRKRLRIRLGGGISFGIGSTGLENKQAN